MAVSMRNSAYFSARDGGGRIHPYYPYYPPSSVIIQQPPEIYVQPAPSEGPAYWYYCKDPQGYYPTVKRCPKGWMRVVPPENPSGGEE